MSKKKKIMKEENEEVKNESQETPTESEPSSAEVELQEMKDKFLRLYSEFDNYKKRTSKERLELFKTAGQDIITSLLPVLDDFDRTMKVLDGSNDIQAIKEGIQLVHSKFKGILEHQGLQSFSAINQEFDADLHEAITNIPAPTDDMKGKVIDEVEKGYKLHDKLIRFAKVVVGE